MPAFDMVCVGAGGGPDETNLSAYLLKPCKSSWRDGVIALEAGSGQGALNQILKRQPDIFASPLDRARYSSAEIYSFVRCYLITHAHLDHINSLVISAGSLKGPRKRVYAAEDTLKDLESVFADRIWPNLASWKEKDAAHMLLYTTLNPATLYTSIFPNISVRMMPINHGSNGTGPYHSAAFFIRYDPTGDEFLFFGDVEPDTIARSPRNIDVWRIAAPKIPTTLSTIFIECSWPSGRPDDYLFGHLTPEHLVAELEVLAAEVVKARKIASAAAASRSSQYPTRQLRNHASTQSLAWSRSTPTSAAASRGLKHRGALDGLRVYVMHCKDNMDWAPDKPIRRVIVEQVRSLVLEKGLGVEVLAAEQGMRIGEDYPLEALPIAEFLHAEI